MKLFRTRYLETVKQIFADQFKPDGQSYLYRRSNKGAPVRVGEPDRDAFVEGFGRMIHYLVWGLAVVAILIVTVISLFDDRYRSGPDYKVFGAVGGATVIFLVAVHWIWNAPVRALERRPEEGAALTSDEAREQGLRATSYGQLALSLPLVGLGLMAIHQDYNLLHGWNKLWLVLGGAFLAFVAYRALSKWRIERRDQP